MRNRAAPESVGVNADVRGEGRPARDTEALARAPIVQPGRNCWRRERAGRVAFLVDGDAYFRAFAAALERAQRSILILSWDIDSRVRIRPDAPSAVGERPHSPSALPDRLGEFLNAIVSRRRGVHAHVLTWDFAMIYAFEREPLPLLKLGCRTHRRLRFRLDGRHPIGACHHQKIVVVDDAIAFAGGLDLCTHRWDTREHRAVDPRRLDAAGRPYGPFHDVQIAVDGAAAAALGQLVRTRWERATGRRVAAPPPPCRDPWPHDLASDLTDVDVAIARTEPAWSGRREVREVEALFLDSIRAARRVLYVENQYLTSARIGDALAARLSERNGPEIVLVVPRHCSGWLEETTMGLLRGALLERLRAADRHDRLRIYCPMVPGLVSGCINVHSKVMVVDDRLVRVGSANLSNRSMGLDTECDLVIDGADEARVARGIAAFRDGLVAEHLDVDRGRVAAAIATHGSLIAAIESLRTAGRTLEPLAPVTPPAGPLLSAAALADPERPVDPERLIEQLLPEEMRDTVSHPFLRGGATILALALALGVSSAMSDRGVVAAILAWTAPLRASAAAPAVVLAAYVLGGLAFVPVTLLILTTMMIFDLPLGVVYGVVGTLAGAATGYLAGRALGRDVVRRLAGRRLNRLTRRLVRRGPMAVAGVRVAALVPFTAMNLVAGASRVRPRDYALGTIIGTVPGVIAIGIVAHGLRRALRVWGGLSIVLPALVGALLLVLGVRLARATRRRLATPVVALEEP